MPEDSSRKPRSRIVTPTTPQATENDELQDAVTDALADWAGREFIDVLLWRITVPLPPPPKEVQARRILEDTPLTAQERIEHDRRARARDEQPTGRVSPDGRRMAVSGWVADPGAMEGEVTIEVRVKGERVELDEPDPPIETLNRQAWNRIQERLAQPIKLRLDQGRPIVTLADGLPIPGQRPERYGSRSAVSPADLIDRLARCAYLPELTDDELARLRAHLDTPVSASRLKKDPLERERRQKLQEILNYNDELVEQGRRKGRPKGRMKREVAEPLIAQHLMQYPHDTAAEVADKVRCSVGVVGESKAWRLNQERLKIAQQQGTDPKAVKLDEKTITAVGGSKMRQLFDHRQQANSSVDGIDEREQELFRQIGEYQENHPDATPEQVAAALDCTARDVERRQAMLDRLAAEQAASEQEDIDVDDPDAKRGKRRKWVEKRT